jgi:transposase
MSKTKRPTKNWKEKRRLHAIQLKRAGWKQKDIATALDVSPVAVCQWIQKMKQAGTKSLRAQPHTGRPGELSSAQKQLIPDLLSHEAEAYGFRGDLWTCHRVKKVIEWEFGVSYHRSHVARLLKELHWTPQQPIERAAQRNDAEISYWRTRTWFEIQKRAVLERRLLVFVDESGFYLLPAILRTYAPIGETPVLKVFHTRDHLSMMSAITTQGWLFTRTRYEALNGMDSVHFLTHVHSQTNRKLLVVWDGAPIHRNTDVREYLANGAAKHIHLEQLPAYAPDLNPDEGTWRHLKRVELANVCCADLLDLHSQVYSAVSRLRHKPRIIQSFFAQAGLPI